MERYRKQKWNINMFLEWRAFLLFALICVSLLTACNGASHSAGDHTSQYAGEELRVIKSLSADDISELKAGSGWGLARAAELNGIPGPVHILELGNNINLTDEQQTHITAIYQGMNSQAVALGEELIQLERELNEHFAERTITEELLNQLVRRIESTRAELRITHLSAHLETPAILTEEQIDQYNQLRGYSDDPCINIPEGHDAERWRKHNDCE